MVKAGSYIPWMVRTMKALEELGELRKSINKFERTISKDEAGRLKAKAMHKIIDSFLEELQKWKDPGRRRFGV